MRDYHPNDYPTLREWWLGWGWEKPVDERVLPTLGAIEPGLAAGFLYLTNSDIGWVTWIVSNPKACVRDRCGALKEVVRAIKELAKEYSVAILYSNLPVKQRGLTRLLRDEGFIVNDEPQFSMMSGV